MFEIKKIESLNLKFINSLENFLDKSIIENDLYHFSNCDKLYNREDYVDDSHPTIPLNKCELSKFENSQILLDMENIIEFLKLQYDAKIIWMNVFYPHSTLPFHMDFTKNRHILSLNSDERFFNYECFETKSQNNHSTILELNDKLKIDNLDNFNKEFLLRQNTRIINLESKSVYSFGDTIHTFVNGSDKIRAAFVFEF
ncbi:hypothetical protein [Flavobacterium sp.]|uniref:hypothetical protein n=1 Tax=Flavobacterium sp. TaxID=239 RepID=UPI0038CF8A1F